MFEIKEYMLEIKLDNKRVFYTDIEKFKSDLNISSEIESNDFEEVFKALKASKRDLKLYRYANCEVVDYQKTLSKNFEGEESVRWIKGTAEGFHFYDFREGTYYRAEEFCNDDINAFIGFLSDYRVDKWTNTYIVIFKIIRDSLDNKNSTRKVFGIIEQNRSNNLILTSQELIKKYVEYSDFRGSKDEKDGFEKEFETCLDQEAQKLLKYFNTERKEKLEYLSSINQGKSAYEKRKRL
ncbi:hypothetical protein KW496_19675 [Vibrio fluvialis]|nr:hypothetical protein [Vibrio fluvialis]